MAEVLLFHHAQGLTVGMHAVAETLRQSGHTVHAPDVFDGRVFDDLEQGVAHAQSIGFGRIMEQCSEFASQLPAELVYLGFSMGVMPAQMLAQQRAGARGALLVDSCVQPTEFGPGWPDGVPVQVHGMDADPWFVSEGDLEAAEALVSAAPDGELFLYPGDQHLFADSSLAAFDEAAAATFTERVLEFLARV